MQMLVPCNETPPVQLSIHLSGPIAAIVSVRAIAEFKKVATLCEEWITETALATPGVLPPNESARLAAEQEIAQDLETYIIMKRMSGWDAHVTGEYFARLEREKLAVYQCAIAGDQALKNRLNKRIGARMKEGLGAVTRASRSGGPPLKGYVTKGLVRMYTKLFTE
jgi:hypothetical protein